jgi:hypothetical protein
MRNFESDPITNHSGKVSVNHPSTITSSNPPYSLGDVNPSNLYMYNPFTGNGTNYGLAGNPNNPSEAYAPGDRSWGDLMSGYVVQDI